MLKIGKNRSNTALQDASWNSLLLPQHPHRGLAQVWWIAIVEEGDGELNIRRNYDTSVCLWPCQKWRWSEVEDLGSWLSSNILIEMLTVEPLALSPLICSSFCSTCTKGGLLSSLPKVAHDCNWAISVQWVLATLFLSNLFPPIIMPAEKERVVMIDIGKTYFLIQHTQKKEEVEELFVHPQSWCQTRRGVKRIVMAI